MPAMAEPCVVVVTGGAGFLGQHVVGLLQARAQHVTEIRVLDVVPYVNKLDYKERLPVRPYVGSITDSSLVDDVCKGAHSVMHIASYVDTTLIPDEDRSYDVNVKGTKNVVSACKKYGVKRLIYCSSTEVVVGKDNIYNGHEDNTTPRLHGHHFETYGCTKMQAEQMVLDANCETLRTVSLRPVVLYGELEWRVWVNVMNNYVTQQTGFYFRLSCGKGRMEHAYVGNVAWGFVCAEKTLVKNDSSSKAASGQGYFIGDDSPKQSLFDFMGPFLQECGLKPFPIDVPLFLIVYPLYLMYMILSLISYFYKINLPHGYPAYMCITRVFLFQYHKATRLLGYQPQYSFPEAKARTVKFLKSIKVLNGYVGKCSTKLLKAT